MWRNSLFILLLGLMVVLVMGCQTAEPEVVEVPVEVEVTRIVELPAEQSEAVSLSFNPMMPVEFDRIASSATGREYSLTVVLPMSYMMTEDDYPVIYVTDGDFYTIPLGVAAAQLAFGYEVPEFIVVGVDYGVADPMQWLELRDEELTFGSEKYLQFFEEELIPHIEATYRADSSNRTLAGHSAGGDFALYYMLHGGDTFNKFITSSPSVASALPTFLEEFAANHGEAATKLYISVGDLDDESLIDGVKTLDDALNEMDFAGLVHETQILDNETHMSARPRAFTSGLRWVFSGEGG